MDPGTTEDAVPGEVWRETFHQSSVGRALLDDSGALISINERLITTLGANARVTVQEAVQSRLAVIGDGPVIVPLDAGVAGRVEPLVLDRDGRQQRFLVMHVVPPHGTDPLTGLMARDQLMNELLRLLGRRDGRGVEVVVLDVDRFKEINDRHGHLVGDEVLTTIADRLLATVRPEDVVCRWGGDEFIVLLDDPAQSDGQAVCARMSDAVGVAMHTRAGVLSVSASCGVVRAEADEGAEGLLERADREMYESKRLRRRSGGPGAQSAHERTQRNRERTEELTQLVAQVRARVAKGRAEMGRGPT